LKTRGAILTSAPGRYEVVDLDLDEPRAGEVLVRVAYAGLCHSDDHLATGDLPVPVMPICGGHEGAGVIEALGPGVTGLAVGDHIVFAFLPVCGRCEWCATGRQNLCDLGANVLLGSRFDDPTSFRMQYDGAPVAQMSGVSTFAEYTTVDVRSVVKIDPDLPLDIACRVGCGVVTGWGAAVNSAETRPGDTVIVMGTGGIGINAVIGAAGVGAAHILAVDPVEMKRERALELGATHAFAAIEEAAEVARQLTNGQGAAAVVVSVGVTRGEHIAQAFAAIRKAGIVVVTGIGPYTEVGIPIPTLELTYFQKQIRGSLFGAANPTRDMPRLLSLYAAGRLPLDELITTRYKLDDIAQGYLDLHAGKNIRGVIQYN
jgi:S-(hydroxymethyl)glutathione dehydrogenase/alcohol dehydrogenase